MGVSLEEPDLTFFGVAGRDGFVPAGFFKCAGGIFWLLAFLPDVVGLGIIASVLPAPKFVPVLLAELSFPPPDNGGLFGVRIGPLCLAAEDDV